MTTPRVHVDFETRSTCDLRTKGGTMYAQHWTTSPLMLAFIGYGEARVFDFMGDMLSAYPDFVYPNIKVEDDPALHAIHPECPALVLKAIADDAIFVAHNARFEQEIWYWICHKRWGWPMPRRWSCTAARSRYNGLRASLAGAGSDLEIVNKKLEVEGDDFIKTYCIPRKYKGAKKNGIITLLWKEPQEDWAGWQRGKDYCLQDAYAEKEIDEALPDLPDFEQAVWELDFKMNTRGLPIDIENVHKAIHFSDHFTQQAVLKFNAITSVNPTQRDRVLEYLNQREELDNLGDLRTKTLSRIVQASLPSDLQDVINIRIEAARASVKKLEAMKNRTSEDGMARGLFLYGGAHTMRWSAKGIQPQNFVRGDARHSELMFEYLALACWDMGLNPVDHMPYWIDEASIRFPRPLGTLSKALRGFIKATPGNKLVVGDYAQIEARVLAWLACCPALLDSYARGEDVYVRFAADHMYGRKYEDYFDAKGKVHKHLAHERQKAKSAVLGAGFGLGAPGFQAYCDNMDIILSEEEAKAVITAYRSAFPEIAHFEHGLWKRVQHCAITAVLDETQVIQLFGTTVKFYVERLDNERWWLRVQLPSGRHISYYRPKVDSLDRWGKPQLSFRTEWMGKSYRESTYGGKIVENIVQAVARDICAQGALYAEAAGYPIIGLVHDEAISMTPDLPMFTHTGLCNELLRVRELPCYAGLPLDAEGGEMYRYGK